MKLWLAQVAFIVVVVGGGALLLGAGLGPVLCGIVAGLLIAAWL